MIKQHYGTWGFRRDSAKQRFLHEMGRELRSRAENWFIRLLIVLRVFLGKSATQQVQICWKKASAHWDGELVYPYFGVNPYLGVNPYFDVNPYGECGFIKDGGGDKETAISQASLL